MSQEDPARQWSWIRDVTVPVLVATVAIVGTYLGASQANGGNQQILAAQIKEERIKADRDKRLEVYLNFLKAADEYAKAIGPEWEKCKGFVDQGTVEVAIKCRDELNTIVGANRPTFYDAYDRMYIFASSEALQAAGEIFNSFPRSAFVADSAIAVHAKFDPNSYTQAVVKLKKSACRDIPANPRETC